MATKSCHGAEGDETMSDRSGIVSREDQDQIIGKLAREESEIGKQLAVISKQIRLIEDWLGKMLGAVGQARSGPTPAFSGLIKEGKHLGIDVSGFEDLLRSRRELEA